MVLCGAPLNRRKVTRIDVWWSVYSRHADLSVGAIADVEEGTIGQLLIATGTGGAAEAVILGSQFNGDYQEKGGDLEQ